MTKPFRDIPASSETLVLASPLPGLPWGWWLNWSSYGWVKQLTGMAADWLRSGHAAWCHLISDSSGDPANVQSGQISGWTWAPQPAGGKWAGACRWLFLAAWWVLVLQCKTKQNIEAGWDCVVRKSSDLPSNAQRLAFHQDMSSFVFQGKDSALCRSSAFTLKILCLTCSLCQKGPDHKKC